MIFVSALQLEELCINNLKKLGVNGEDAKVIANCLVKADLLGMSSHGVFRLPTYLKRVKLGLIKLDSTIEIIRETPSVVVLNGGMRFGQIVGVKAMNLAIEKAQNGDLGFVSVFNSNHFGITSYYSMIALKHMMIGIVISNTNPAMAPWGGTKKLLGTNPLSVAIPAGEERPIILDIAMSKVARGKIRLAAEKGEEIPEGWAIDESGHPTTDPFAALRGSLLPIGGPKGSGLSLVVDILSGLLSGGSIGREVRSMYDMSGPSRTCHTMMAINIESFVPTQHFKDRIDKMIKNIKSSPCALGVSEVFLPGEMELKTEEKRLKEGIPFDEKTWTKLIESLELLTETEL